MNKQSGFTFTIFVLGMFVLSWSTPVKAYEGFDDGGGAGEPGCATCHSSLANFGPAHATHAAPVDNCSSCHGSGGRDNPPLSACVQCHGREADGGNDNISAGIGRGLRLHHVTVNASACDNCHSDATSPTNVGEEELPAFYASALNSAGLDTCDGSEDNFASRSVSLDNDGDGLTDGADPDCVNNEPPVADPNGPYNASVGSPVNFDGTGSSDPDGTITTYAWDFGDGGTGNGATPTHTYSVDGVFTVTLTVTDNDGQSASDTSTATINPAGSNTPPSADTNGPYSGLVGAAILFDGSGSTDADGAIVRYDWDFGDGTTVDDAGPAPSHAYGAAGDYTVTLTVTDDMDATDSATAAVSISDPVPVTDGETQYNNYCSSCHSDPWTGPAVDSTLPGLRRVTGARACVIDGSIFGTYVFPNGAPGMEFLQDLVNNGTIDSVEIAKYLNSQPVTGEAYYVTACAGCHGNDGSGGRTRESVLGESAHETREAINEESTMRYLACLPNSDIEAITTFLGGDNSGIDDDEDSDSGGGASGLLFLVLLAISGLFRPRSRRKRT